MKIQHCLLIFLLVLVCIITVAIILPTQKQNREMKAKIEELQKEVSRLSQKKQMYQDHIQILEKDPFYPEYLLRTKFYYARKNETMLK